MSLPGVKKVEVGDWARFDVPGSVESGICIGLDYKNDRRIYSFDNGFWCYEDEVLEVRQDDDKQEKSCKGREIIK
jgi:hypothetical protein